MRYKTYLIENLKNPAIAAEYIEAALEAYYEDNKILPLLATLEDLQEMFRDLRVI